jgi:hypothetical protein
MQIPVLVERVEGSGYRARAGEPLPLTAEGATGEEALQKLREMITSRMASGSWLLQLNVDGAEHPLAKFAGMWKDDPFMDEWVQAIEEYRREVDADPNY